MVFTTEEVLSYHRKFILRNYVDLLKRYQKGDKDFTKSHQWRRHKRLGRSDEWIEENNRKFFKLFENIKKKGFRETGSPFLMVKMGNRYIRQNGAHRVAIAYVLRIKNLECEVE